MNGQEILLEDFGLANDNGLGPETIDNKTIAEKIKDLWDLDILIDMADEICEELADHRPWQHRRQLTKLIEQYVS